MPQQRALVGAAIGGRQRHRQEIARVAQPAPQLHHAPVEKARAAVVVEQVAVEMGVRDAMEKGPLGYPVVDVAVTLIDGSFHSVDSSELAFRIAGRIAMSEALPQCRLSARTHVPPCD